MIQRVGGILLCLSLVGLPGVGFAQIFKPPVQSLLGTWGGEVNVLAIEDDGGALLDDLFDVPPVQSIQPILLTGDVVMSISFHEGNFFVGVMELVERAFDKNGDGFNGVIVSPSFVYIGRFDIMGTAIGKKITFSSLNEFGHIEAKFIGDSQIKIEFDFESDICVEGRAFCRTAFINALGMLTRQ